MMLQFSDPAKLKTKKVVFEDIYPTFDSGSLEQMKELSTKRRAIEESINDSSFMTDTIAREMSGGLTSRCQQDLQKIEQYLPLLVNLLSHVQMFTNNYQMVRWNSNLNIRWSSALKSNVIKVMCTKLYRADDLRFELGMTYFLYGAILRERALEVVSMGTDLVEAATLYRKAAGIFSLLSEELFPQLETMSQERPPEATPLLNSIMSLICLAEAQAVTVKRAEEKGSTGGLLSKLHYGIKLLLDEANSTLHSSKSQRKAISQRLEDFICYCGELHELRSQKYLAESYYKDDQLGFAIGIIRRALHKIKGKMPGDEPWRLIFKREIGGVAEMLRKLEHENGFVNNEKIPSSDQLPSLEGKKIVTPIRHNGYSLDTKITFKF